MRSAADTSKSKHNAFRIFWNEIDDIKIDTNLLRRVYKAPSQVNSTAIDAECAKGKYIVLRGLRLYNDKDIGNKR